MRKILTILLILIITISILWIFAGRQVSEFVDRFGTREVESSAIHSISYEGAGDGGTLIIDAAHPLDLAPLNPHIGTTKDGQLALSFGGKVFAFGPVDSTGGDTISAKIPDGDSSSLTGSHGFLPWLDLTALRVDHVLRCRRHWYQRLTWAKPSGAKLNVLWQSEEHWDSNAAPPDYSVYRLIRVEISNASR